MRIAITGATGNVGTSLIEVLSTDDRVERIVGISRRRPDWDPGKTMWIEADVGRDDLTEAIEGIDAVIHLAWLIQPSRDENLLKRTNVEGSSRVFEAAAAAGVQHLIYASTIGVYSPAPKDEAIDESFPTDGVETSQYSRHKVEVERILDRFEASHPDMRVVRMRPAVTFKRESAGSQLRYFTGQLVPALAIRYGLIRAFPHDPAIRIQLLHSIDAAEAYRAALFSDAAGAFNVAADPVLTTADVAKIFGAVPIRVPSRAMKIAAGVSYRLRMQPSEPGWVDLARAAPIMDSSRARKELGWEPRYTSREALEELLAGVKDTTGMPTPPLASLPSPPERIKQVVANVRRR